MKKLMITLLAGVFVSSQIFAGCGCGGGRINNTKPNNQVHNQGKK